MDGTEHLVALLSSDCKSVHQAIWTRSLYLSWVYHSALSCEAILGALHGAIERGASSDELRAALNELLALKAVDAPGYQALLRRARILDSENNAEPRTDAGREKQQNER